MKVMLLLYLTTEITEYINTVEMLTGEDQQNICCLNEQKNMVLHVGEQRLGKLNIGTNL